MSKLNKSWEKIRDELHSPEGIFELRKSVKYGLTKKYMNIFQNMWKWEFEGEQYDDLQVMSQDTVPEKFLVQNGECVAFRDPSTNQVHILPFVMNGGFNIYGRMTEWSPVPVGYTDEKAGTYPEAVEKIRNLKLNIENSVIIRNDRFGTGDKTFIEAMVNELVDNVLTLNQLQLIASSPIFFNVTADNVLTAKNVYLAIAERRPVMFTNADGEKIVPQLEVTNVKIDPGLLELFDRWESILLSYGGINCVPITKRAQQTVSEVQVNNDEIRLILDGKYFYRDVARERMEKMFGGKVKMINMINEWRDEKMENEMKTIPEESYD